MHVYYSAGPRHGTQKRYPSVAWPTAPRGQRLPIDFFFRSLAQDQHERAIGIVLSGTGSDGSMGVRAIKDAGGMVMVQNPESTEYDGMPRSALATGLVDYELPPAEMPARLIAYVTHAFGTPPKRTAGDVPKTENALKKLFLLLRSQTGHDFSLYKPNTINRRIERRMAVAQIKSIEEYIKYAQQMPAEIEALFRDLLIGVTQFFRDPAVFTFLEEKVIPCLLDARRAEGAVRLWVPGCATSEEAYSLAILLAERLESLRRPCSIQIFATDIDSLAIASARAGLYPASIKTDISSDRLARFFTVEPGGMYRIHKSIRDMLVFSAQDVIRDPPFSKLDLISCRNLLIYMSSELQKKLIPLFHYALNPGGFLVLGTSESVGEYDTLFAVQERKQKIYRRKEFFGNTQRPNPGRIVSARPSWAAAQQPLPEKSVSNAKLPLRELTEQALLQQIAPSAILVNSSGDILYLHGRTGLFLEPSPGVSGVANVIRMAREGLRRDLTTALHSVVKDREIACCKGLHVKTNGDYSMVNLTVRPVAVANAACAEPFLYLVILELASSGDTERLLARPVLDASEDQNTIVALQQKLRDKQENLQSTNEELKSSNEEMQSMNEEMQSINEELETSGEELQSVNEELFTVNTELQSKLANLSRSNNDMNNLLSGTGIGTMFVDQTLHILRFTPTVTKIINLIQSDVGRPVSHILSNLKDYDNLVPDIQSVLDNLEHKELELETTNGVWYTMRIQPYRTLNNEIEGAVITFVDISRAKKLQEELHNAQMSAAENIVATVREPLLVLDADLRVKSANRAFYTRFQVEQNSAVGNFLYDLGNRQWNIPALRTLLEEILLHNTVVSDYEVMHVFEQIGPRTMRLNARRLFRKTGETELILLAIEDVTK
ncbi:MAG: PAS domain-containing protein [Desulforhopalus sp.]|nr:PAS domain-containing protein [Desulforhopalus sp.]